MSIAPTGSKVAATLGPSAATWAAVACGACGVAITVLAETPTAIRILGAAIVAISVIAVMANRRDSSHRLAPATVRDAAAPVAMLESNAGIVRAGDDAGVEATSRRFGSAMVDQVEGLVRQVLGENDQMREMAREMATASAQAKEQFQKSMTRAVEAEDGIEQLRAFSSDLNGSIRVIRAEVENSVAIVKDATEDAAETRRRVETMATLSLSVADIVKVIDEIARQTRMLALNATIEAARAGEAGKGFAVVANEVKQLAHKTADATDVIGKKIAEMNATVAESVASLQLLVGTIGRVDAASGSIGAAITEQEGLARRASTSVESMGGAVFSLSREIREAAQIAANSGMLSDMVLQTANSVDGHMIGLKSKLVEIAAGTDVGPIASVVVK